MSLYYCTLQGVKNNDTARALILYFYTTEYGKNINFHGERASKQKKQNCEACDK